MSETYMEASVAATRPDPIHAFAELTSEDTLYAGGKGANLGQLTRAE